MDTEIEVTDTPQGRCAEITKQRDLHTKGDRIGFTLKTVTLGQTTWGAAATACVVEPSSAPEKAKGKRMGAVEGAVAEFLAASRPGKSRADVVEHFSGRYEKSNVYRDIRSLTTGEVIHEVSGLMCIAGAAK